MALVSMRQLLDHAAENSYGLPAFNVNNLEQMRAIMEAANQINAPVIVQASAGARKYAGAPFLRHLILAAVEEFPHIPVVMHQDHGASPDVCQRSIQLGFSSVMMDGSLLEDGKTPSTYEYNVNATRTVVNFSHACGVSVEGEIGVLGNLETGEAGEEDGVGAAGKLSHDQMLTSVEDAVRFVKDTGVDALAIAVGTSHGAYKFTRPPTGDVLRIDRIKEIHQALPNTHIVMHGSSSVPQEWLKVINEYGGNIVVLPGIDSLAVMHERGDALAVQLVDQCLPVREILRQDAAFPDFVRYCAGMEGQIYGGFSPDFIDLAGMDALNRAADDARRILDLWSSTEALPAGAEDAAGGAAVTGAGNARNAGRLPASGAKRATDGLPPKPF